VSSTGTLAVHMSISGWLAGRPTVATLGGMTRASDEVGAYGERRAVEFLTNEMGMWVLDRNWRCGDGELDIVCRHGGDLVFVEVKTRRGHGFGSPAEALVPDKVRRLRRLGMLWLAEHPMRPREIRFDVVCVYRPRRGPALIHHIPGAF
jgi:putative endonuclease